MATYKLVYFKTIRATILRLILKAAGQDFEDIPVDKSEWAKYKDDAPLGQVPYFSCREENGKHLEMSQTMAIARFLAKRLNLAGKDEHEQAIVDMWSEQLTDLRNEFHQAYVIQRTNEKQMERFRTDYTPRYFKSFHDQLAKNKTGYLVGDSLTWIDLFLFNYTHALVGHLDWDAYPEIKTHYEKIKNLPSLDDFHHY
jgi:glutathione S-transferase